MNQNRTNVNKKMNNSELFSKRTDELALKLRLSLKELAALIGVSPGSFFGYRTGRIRVTSKAWAKLEAAESGSKTSPTSLHESRPVYRISSGQSARLAADLEKHRSLDHLSEARRGEIETLVGQRLLELSDSGPGRTESILSEISDAVRSYSRWLSAVREDSSATSSPVPGPAREKTA